MGLISQLAGKSISVGSTLGQIQIPSVEDRNRSRQIWREIFGSTNKEDTQPVSRPVANSWGRSVLSSDASYKRLLQAMRSMAPGGWSDDRWEQTRHWEGIGYIAGHRKCEQMSMAEFQVFEKDPHHPDGKRPVEPDHPLIKLLEQPNPQDTFGDLMYRWGQQMDLTGKALTWMVPNMLGSPMELYSIPTAIAIPQPAINPDYPDGYYRIQPVYPYGPFSSYPTPATAVGAPIPAQWMVEFKYPHPLLRYDGYSPQTALRMHIDEVLMIDKSRHYKMRRSINPSAVLQCDEMEGSQHWQDAEVERVKAEFENELEGPENAGKLYVAAPGSRLEEFGMRPVDMDYFNGWEQLVAFVLSGFGIGRAAAGMSDDAAYANLWAGLKQLYWLTLDPVCNRISQQLTRRLTPFFGHNLLIEIRCRRIDDKEQTMAEVGLLTQCMAITKNEVRKKMDMHVTKEPWGQEISGKDSQQLQQGQQQLEMGRQQMQMQEEQANMMKQDPNAMLAAMQGAGQQGPPGSPEEAGGAPDTGEEAKGSLGPRKSITDYFKKSIKQKPLYDRIREALHTNGNGHKVK